MDKVWEEPHCGYVVPPDREREEEERREREELRALAVQDPRVPIVANVDAVLKHDAAAAVEALISQVSAARPSVLSSGQYPR